MFVVWNFALEPAALNVIRIMAMLDPDSIPEDVLIGDVKDPSLVYLGYSDRFR